MSVFNDMKADKIKQRKEVQKTKVYLAKFGIKKKYLSVYAKKIKVDLYKLEGSKNERFKISVIPTYNNQIGTAALGQNLFGDGDTIRLHSQGHLQMLKRQQEACQQVSISYAQRLGGQCIMEEVAKGRLSTLDGSEFAKGIVAVRSNRVKQYPWYIL